MTAISPLSAVLAFIPLFLLSERIGVDPHLVRETNRLILTSTGVFFAGWGVLRGRRPILGAPLLLFFFATGVSALASDYLWESLRGWSLVVGTGLLYYGISVFPARRKEILQTLAVVAVVGFLLVLAALAIHYSAESYADVRGQIDSLPGDELMKKRIRYALLLNRARAFFGNPNHLAGWLNLFAVVPVAYLFFGGRRILRWLSLPWLLCYGVLLLLTESKGGMLSFAAAVFLIVLLKASSAGGWSRLQTHRKTIVVAGVTVCAALVLVFSLGGGERLAPILRSDTMAVRIENWGLSLEMVRDYPLLGIGPEMFSEYVPHYRAVGGSEMQYAHNLYLEAMVEAGVLGLLSLLLLQGAVVRLLWRGLREARGEERIPQASALGAFAAYTLHGCIDFNHIQPEILFLVAFLVALASNRGALGGRRQRPSSFPARLPFSIAALAFLAGFEWFFVVSPYQAQKEETSAGAALGRDIPDKGAALRRMEDAVVWTPWDAELHSGLSRLYRMAGHRHRALEEILVAIRLNPHAGRYLHALSRMQADAGKNREALDSINRAVALHPAKADYYTTRAEIHERLNMPEAAEKDRRLAQERIEAEKKWDPGEKIKELESRV